MDAIAIEVRKAVRRALQPASLSAAPLPDNAPISGAPGYTDSLDKLAIVAEVEDTFDISITDLEVSGLETTADLVALTVKKVAAR